MRADEAGSVRGNPALRAVVVLGIIARICLVPWTHGQDFVVWDLASRATLHGVNIYAHHPNYPYGPFAYLPLFVYLELPFAWLTSLTGLPFTVLGKVPILAGDLLALTMIVRLLAARGASDRAVAAGAGLFFLNPLVLYDGAYYGRFDSLATGLLLVAIGASIGGRGTSGAWLALAAAAKTFPVFALPGLLRASRGRSWSFLIPFATVLITVVVPYLQSWRPMLHDVILYDANKRPQKLSLQTLVAPLLSSTTQRVLALVLLGAFAIAAILCARMSDLIAYTAVVLTLFVMCSDVVLDQYLVWLVPLLVLLVVPPAARRRRLGAGALLGVATVVGMLANADIHPWGRSPVPLICLLFATCAVFVVVTLLPRRPREGAAELAAVGGVAPGGRAGRSARDVLGRQSRPG